MGFRELESSCTPKVLCDWEEEDLQPLWAPGSFLENERMVYALSSSNLCAKPHLLPGAPPSIPATLASPSSAWFTIESEPQSGALTYFPVPIGFAPHPM